VNSPKKLRAAALLLIVVVVLFALVNGGPATTAILIADAKRESNSPRTSPQTPPTSDIPWRESRQKFSPQQLRVGDPNKARLVTLDKWHLESLLRKAPREFTEAAKREEASISLPMPDGSFMRFQIQESPVMEPALAARYPDIRTFRGQALDGQIATTRFDWTPQGFHGILLTPRGTVLIEPEQANQTSDYLAYFQGDTTAGTMECEVDGPSQDALVAAAKQTSGEPDVSPLVSSGSNLRTYRLAVAATAEYTQTFGNGTVSGALAAITTTVNLVNAIFERDVAVRLVLIANETSIIFTDTTTDGYTSNSPTSLITENQSRLDAIIGSENYDIGHVFDGQQFFGGFSFQGIASFAVVCRAGAKGRGVSIIRGLSPSNVISYYNAAHEMGHQFGASHTFNATSGSCGAQRASSTAYEPGTGSTIMGYRFACSPEDLMSSDTYFHNISLEQIVTYTTTGNGNSCPTVTPTGNNIPTVDAGPSFTIPQSTPFQLTASGSDPDGDTLTYSWEQFDLGTAGPPNTDNGSRPIFRSSAPSPDPIRLFPNLNTVLCVFCGPALGESMATTTRTLNFRVAARDNRSDGGAVSSDSTHVNVRSESGPFTVNGPPLEWLVKSQQLVTWNVANTTSAPVSCSHVKISLSTDSGNTFPIILANSTPNDGSEVVTIPGTHTSSGRIKVEAVGNVFFNISPNVLINGVHDVVPTISNVSPGTGTTGTQVTINGTNFISPSAVRFNGVAATFTVNSTTQIVANVPIGASSGPITVITNDGSATSPNQFNLSFPSTVQLNSGTGAAGENASFLSVVVNRTGDTSAPSTVKFATGDTAGLTNCTVANGIASERCDYATTVGTLRFAAGETSKTIIIPLINDALVEGNETFTLKLSSPTGASLGTSQATITINDNDAAPAIQNPIDGVDPFVTQQYIDFLGRLPDSVGFANWKQTLGGCPNGGFGEFDNPTCDRVHVSAGFFLSVEFQGRGYFAYRFYEVALNRRPTYAEFVPDMAQVGGAQSPESEVLSKAAYTQEWTQRPAFKSLYDGMTNQQYVDALEANAEVTLANKAVLVSALNGGTTNRGQVLRDIVETQAVANRFFNRAFVSMQYFGYLRRDPDTVGFQNWLNTLNANPSNFRHMIFGFLFSTEYRQRFGQ
jgi:hypothetical protein